MTGYVYQLVVQLAGDSIADYDAMIELEEYLCEGLGDDHDVDGHDVGSGEINIFIHTNDPYIAGMKVRELLSAGQQRSVKIAFRPFESEVYVVLWPTGEKSFNIP